MTGSHEVRGSTPLGSTKFRGSRGFPLSAGVYSVFVILQRQKHVLTSLRSGFGRQPRAWAI